MHEYLLQHAAATELYRHIPYSDSGMAAALRWLNQPARSGPIVLGGGSASSSKLVRDDPYPYSLPRPFIRSRKVDEDPDDPDADEYDPELALDFDDTSERRGCGSGGTSGTSVKDDDLPREGARFAAERCGRTERVVGGARVGVLVFWRGL